MLTTLKIKNYALLKDLSITFDKGFNVLTGETGAGKSIIIGALNIALGERGYTENIRTGEEKAIIEAEFVINDKNLISQINSILENSGIENNDNVLIIKREINRKTKGRIFINNTLCSLSVLQKIGKLLVDIHGQHEHQSLLKTEIHIDLLDSYIKTYPLREEVGNLYNKFININSKIDKLKNIEKEKNEKLDFLNYRIKEIEEANFTDDNEYEELLREREILINSEELTKNTIEILNTISPASFDIEKEGILDAIENIKEKIENIKNFDKNIPEFFLEILDDVYVKIEEIKNYFLEYKDKIEFDENRLKEVEDRIDFIESLMKKYNKKSIKEIKDYYNELKAEKNKIEKNDEEIKNLEKEKDDIVKVLKEKSLLLSKIRHEKSIFLSKNIENELKGLGIEKAQFMVEVKDLETEKNISLSFIHNNKAYKITPTGINSVEFLISLNPGEELKPLVKVASGGEISRIMLAIKNILSDVDKIPVLVFDEIDTGISGKIASVVGKKLYEISKKKQLICITHLPQIASYSDKHFSVSKIIKGKRTETIIKELNKDEKINEIAKLISGENLSDSSIEAAKDLIKSTEKIKK